MKTAKARVTSSVILENADGYNITRLIKELCNCSDHIESIGVTTWEEETPEPKEDFEALNPPEAEATS